jgi:hypothetical protein
VWLGGVIVMQGCVEFPDLPRVVLSDANNGLIVLLVDPGDVVTFPASVKVYMTTKHYIVAQMTANMYTWDLRFTVTSAKSVRRCGEDRIGSMHCW